MTGTSGTYNFSLGVQEAIVEAFDRIGIRPPEIGTHQLLSAKRSSNLILSELLTQGVNLWVVDLQTVPLTQGVTSYTTPSTTVDVLDAYVRQYSMNGVTSVATSFSTTSGSPSVTINWTSSGATVGQYVSVAIPVSVGGLIIFGFYPVTTVLNANSFTITAATNATGNVTNGGVLPIFTTTSGSSNVNVLLPNHGLVSGGTFVVQASTLIGGVTLFGSYTISTVIDANNFTIPSAYVAGSSATMTENAGLSQLATQQANSTPVDRVIYPISRTDYADTSNKYQQSFPTSYWFDRLLNPVITLWPVPDGNGPYALMYYRAVQIQDANPQYNQKLDVPNRFYEAFCAQLAWKLAMKWKPELEAVRKADALMAMSIAIADDRERVSMFFQPDFSPYYQ